MSPSSSRAALSPPPSPLPPHLNHRMDPLRCKKHRRLPRVRAQRESEGRSCLPAHYVGITRGRPSTVAPRKFKVTSVLPARTPRITPLQNMLSCYGNGDHFFTHSTLNYTVTIRFVRRVFVVNSCKFLKFPQPGLKLGTERSLKNLSQQNPSAQTELPRCS